MGLIDECYIGINKQLYNPITIITKVYAIKFYFHSVSSLPFVKKLYVMNDRKVIKFWTLIDPNDYDSRDKIYDLELELRDKFKDEKIMFEFNVFSDTSYFMQQIPENAKTLIK
ncbi:hypothetical protein [Methanoculleus sp.]|uniref:hypothetical protein n=1 Tax=Methanoculleus sp. TaxID=90427 RepID=UPI0025E225C6|nr:hypothetical protein [Methanoculleus sp.]MCK9319154.1 hypothetical protein [Methanoculleus sp.]